MNVERILRSLLATALVLGLLAAVGCESAPTGNASSQQSAAADVSSETPSSETLSSEEAVSQEASQEVSSQEKLPLRDERGYVIVRNMLDELDLSFNGDTSACFPADAAGYIVEGGPYPVDADTLRRLTTAKVEGSGTVKWIGYKEFGNTTDSFSGEVPVAKLSDPAFMSMNLPSEAPTFMKDRINAQNMSTNYKGATRALPIAAIYRNTDVTLDDDETFTLCLGRITMIMRTKTEDWHLTGDWPYPSNPKDIYFLPWGNNRTILNPACLSEKDDHMEVTLTGADLNATERKKTHPEVKGAVLHFWGSFTRVDSSEVLGMVSSFVAWVQEPESEGKLVLAIGIDWYGEGAGALAQAYSGYNYLLTDQPRICFGHTVGPKAYDTVMDTETVQRLLGLK